MFPTRFFYVFRFVFAIAMPSLLEITPAHSCSLTSSSLGHACCPCHVFDAFVFTTARRFSNPEHTLSPRRRYCSPGCSSSPVLHRRSHYTLPRDDERFTVFVAAEHSGAAIFADDALLSLV